MNQRCTGWRERLGREGFCLWLLLVGVAPAVSLADTTVLRVGVYENPPKVQLVEGQLSGIFGDVLQEIARREDWQIEPVPCVWEECLRRLREGELDLMPDTAINQARDQRLAFHDTAVLRSWSQLYSARQHNISSLLDLEGLRITVVQGSVQQSYLRNLLGNFAIPVEWVPVADFGEGFEVVRSGLADVVAANHFYGDRRARELGLYSTPVIFQPAALYFAGRPGLDPTVLHAIDRHLQAWQAQSDSPWQQALVRWGAFAPGERAPVHLYWLGAALLLAAILALSLALIQRRRHHQMRARLDLSEMRLETILDGVDACIFIKDQEGRYQYVNRCFAELFGRPVSALLEKTDRDLFDNATAVRIQADDRKVFANAEKVSAQQVNTLRDGTQRTFFAVKLPLFDSADRPYALCGIATDVTEHLRIQEALNRAQYNDPVTGLANRLKLLEHLEHALASYTRTGFEGALLSVDLRDFSLINDTLGHSVGDEVLRLVAARIRRGLAGTDIAARLGADDFVVVLEDLSADRETAVMAARSRASDLASSLSEPYRLADTTQSIGVNIGVTMFSDASDEIEGLLRNADLALAASREQGSGDVRFFDPLMQERVNHRLRLESALRAAIEGQDLELYLQPQADESYQVFGMEVLLRWQHAELGVVSPAEFIPLAEASGLIVPLGEQVLQRSCALLRQWQDHPLLGSLTLAVNISPRQFRQADFVSQVQRCLDIHQVPAGRLVLEVTEGMLIDDVEDVTLRMRRLEKLGVRFALDDFGTGYASLAYLKRLPLFQLKIDQSFVRDLLTDRNDEIIIASTLEMGRSLGLEVIAEGVETADQLRALEVLGCRRFQGYSLGRPAPVARWEERFQASLVLSPEEVTGTLAGAPETSRTSRGSR